jgi:hypothetical protein
MTDPHDAPPPRPAGSALGGFAVELPPELAGADEARIWEWASTTGTNPLPVRALQIETSSICNFRCASCPLSLDAYDRPQKHLCKVEFERILDAFPQLLKSSCRASARSC